ncbi:hypothetical protein HG535_0H04190 [Zygotorulaspora mrakii]|uniref:Nudix hydrolase domain-containing protein n=1 Tax=Zygotorulaspora mrakii TaxID=42260 RepID=A0A7H9BBF8_ZYGMR|nr:uncharacterized protein HG535_0H04190 [Zygotorulaspora mrakii]QLG75092.1 hypothetical protein HG535_0H04190 [Zygotorulaspora mrakii]
MKRSTDIQKRMMKVTKTGSDRQILVRDKKDEANTFSFLEIAEYIDGLPLDYERDENFQDNVYYLTTHDDIRVGFVLKFVIEEMKVVCPTIFDGIFVVDTSTAALKFRSPHFDERNAKLDALGNVLHEKSSLEGIKGWRNEKYTVWTNGQPYVYLERAMAGIMGIITYGVHVNGYILNEVTNEIKFWIPKRSATKQTWPLMLDNIVAGGIASGFGVYDTVLKESMEEANLIEDTIKPNIKAAGVVSYLHFMPEKTSEKFKDESSFIVGEVEYIYDLRLPSDIIPVPNDGEVDSFNLLSLQEVIDALVSKKFKPNCGLVMVDFLIRHGYITTDNEPNYLKLVAKMHRTLPFPTAT